MATQWVALMLLLLLSSSLIEAHQQRKISRSLLSTSSGGIDGSRAASSCSKDKTLCSTQKTGDGKSQYFSNPGCCGDKCVETDTDRANCGKCGNRCSFGYVCCGGQCKNVNGSDRYNCGKCGNKCESGVECTSGMCGYGSAGGGKSTTSPEVAYING